jgi:phage repressor protein C with HTH and peptisase S24 domain
MKTVEEVKKFLADKIAEKGLSYNNLSLQIGKNQTYLQQFVTRDSPKRLGEFERKALANILNVNEQDLSDKPINIMKPDIIQIDVLDVRACCGNGIENFTENVIGQQMMTLPALRELTESAPENIKIIKAIGESMMPTIHTDDIVWIDISVKTPTSDGLYILCVGSDLLIRRIQINPFDNTATVIADNNKYLPIPRQNYRDINVVGKVIYHMRKTA